jgi:steroid delta-isomerase
MDHRAIIDAYIAGVASGDVEGLVALFRPDAALQMPLYEQPLVGTDAIRAFYTELLGRWTTGIELTIHAVAIDGDVGMFEFTFMMTVPGGGQHVAASVDVFHFEDGLIRRMRAYTDGAALRAALDAP